MTASALRKCYREYGRAVVRRDACKAETQEWYAAQGSAGYWEEYGERLEEVIAIDEGRPIAPPAERELLRAEAVERARKAAERASKKEGKA